ncbi:hypothetical protein CAPTEDRAFT_140582 [Capitella teleta]|uniref:Sulfotransferase domain-containing protein n=1 Tax=Capitella teleta TaxID=283909 RepID=R7UF64_CAPTE|nr:hypothetical protein CAPTEDRAFT_140582 [Capitella teleta]|eukprot:ELU05174.1 hypothetical protein CAPTEDRAFT_140582 [Capitella teleta]
MYAKNSYRRTPRRKLQDYFHKLRHLYKPWHKKRRRCLPKFYILGFPKCGTTDLYITLKKHPKIADDIPAKEPAFWNRHNFAREPITRQILSKCSFSSYVDLYDLAAFKTRHNRKQIIVDASVSYIWDYGDWPNIPLNKGLDEPSIITAHFIRHFTPGAKFIILVREPSERIYSQYLYVKKGGESKFNFHAAVVEGIDLMQRCMKERSQRDCLYDPTFNRTITVWLQINHYVTFIQDWLSVFPREQFYFLRLEDYMVNKTKAIIKISRFLGTGELSKSYVKYLNSTNQFVENARSAEDMKIGDMLPETKLLLHKYFDPWNKRLAALLNDSSFIYQYRS